MRRLYIGAVTRRPPLRQGRVASTAASSALLAAVVSLVGVAIAFDPVATGLRVLGSLLLGAAALAAAKATAGATGASATPLWILGALGLFLLPLWPLVYAVEVVPAAGGTGVLAVFGLGWVALGVRPFGTAVGA